MIAKAIEVVPGTREAPEQQRARERAARRGEAERQRRECRRRGERPLTRPADRARPCRTQLLRRLRRCFRRESAVRALRFRAPRQSPSDQMRGDDRAGGGAHEVLAAAHVDAVGVLEPAEDAHHPRLAEDASSTKHQHVGGERHRRRLATAGNCT